MRLISLNCQKNCVWPSLKSLIRGGRISLLRALHGLWGGEFRLRMDIYVHPGINKGGIQRKHISLL